jgi:hypothetical protein
MVAYLGRIIDQLENGRPEIVGLNLPELFLAEAGGYA